jgi:hypothetical protein
MQGTIDVVAMPAEDSKPMGSLGPMAGAWGGYSDLAPESAMRAKALVGHIHAQAENCARAAIDIGMRLITLKELLPHGQFMTCVQAEFGWTAAWSAQLMHVAQRFSNLNSSLNLPSSAKVLALLASSGADDATVQQAAEERWTVAETKQRLRRPASPRQHQPAEALALNMIRKGEVDRLRAALALAERAEVVTPQQVMEEQRLRDLGKLRVIPGMAADFHRMKDGSWVRLPHAGEVDVTPTATPEPEPVGGATPVWDAAPLLSVGAAAQRLGMKEASLTQSLTPSACEKRNGAPLIRNGFKVTREGRGMVRLTPQQP